VDGAPDDSSHYGACLWHPDEVDLFIWIVGLELARLADLPEDVLTEAYRVSGILSMLHAKREDESEGSRTAIKRKALLRVTLFLHAFILLLECLGNSFRLC